MLVIRARGLLGTGALAAALEDCAEAINRARSQRQPAHLCEALIVEARGLRLLHGLTARVDIETRLAEAEQIIVDCGAERFRAHVHVERAALSRASGDEESWAHELRAAHHSFESTGAHGYADRVADQLAQ